MNKVLSILICSLYERSEMLAKLISVLKPQITDETEVKLCIDNREATTGVKRNSLLEAATGKYVVFIDDDDLIAETYVQDILHAAKNNKDAIVFKGWMTTNGKDKKRFELSKDFDYVMKNDVYYRYPNHLTPIRSTIAKKFKFPDKVHGEDYQWATAIHKSGLIKTETKINKELYFYLKMRKYSQNNEQQIILKYLKAPGTFLDLGAYTGIELSNVRALAELGWKGVMVEASPTVFKKLKANYKEFPDIQLVNCAVGGSTGVLDFYDNHNAVGTLYKNETYRWTNEKFNTIEVPCMEIGELLDVVHYKKFDFISCDIEGEDLNVVRRLDLKKLGTKLICVEWNGKNKSDYDNIIMPQGFKLVHKNGENLIYSV